MSNITDLNKTQTSKGLSVNVHGGLYKVLTLPATVLLALLLLKIIVVGFFGGEGVGNV